jgi:hypothetical protein
MVLVQLGSDGRPVEPERIGVDTLLGQDLALLPPLGAQQVSRARRGDLVDGLVRHSVRVGLGRHTHSFSLSEQNPQIRFARTRVTS